MLTLVFLLVFSVRVERWGLWKLFFFVEQIFYLSFFFTLHVHEGKCLTDFILSNLFCVGQCIHNQYAILCIKIYSHPIFSDWLYLILFLPIINSHCRDVKDGDYEFLNKFWCYCKTNFYFPHCYIFACQQTLFELLDIHDAVIVVITN